MSSRTRAVVVILAACLIGLGAAGATQAQEKVLKIGGISPYTGPASRTGAEFKAAMQLAFEKVGHKIGDYKVELYWIDCQSDPAKASAAYAEAVERHGVQATLNMWHSSVAIALIDLAAKYKVPHYFGPGGASKVVNEKYQSNKNYAGFWLKGMPTPPKVTRKYVDAIENAVKKGLWKPANKKVAIFGEETDWGRGIGEGFREQFTKAGWEIATEDYFSMTQTEFHALMNKYKQLDVSILAGTHSGTAAISAFIKQADEVGLKAVIAADGLGWVGEWYKLTGKASNGVLDSTPVLVTPAAKAWAEEMKKKFKIEPGGQAAICYDFDNFFIKIAKRALEKYGKIDKETLLKINLEEVIPGKLTFTAADGAVIMKQLKFTPEDVPDPVFGPDFWYIPIVQYFDGKGYVVFPEDWKMRDFQGK
ncbi:MAG: ABC transporter substrate-binding protein [Thermodesulfobacteriota bacterium]